MNGVGGIYVVESKRREEGNKVVEKGDKRRCFPGLERTQGGAGREDQRIYQPIHSSPSKAVEKGGRGPFSLFYCQLPHGEL